MATELYMYIVVYIALVPLHKYRVSIVLTFPCRLPLIFIIFAYYLLGISVAGNSDSLLSSSLPGVPAPNSHSVILASWVSLFCLPAAFKCEALGWDSFTAFLTFLTLFLSLFLPSPAVLSSLSLFLGVECQTDRSNLRICWDCTSVCEFFHFTIFCEIFLLN